MCLNEECNHAYRFIGFGYSKVDYYDYECWKCKYCGKTEIKNKRYRKLYDEGGIAD